jgi:hypothetical protein
MQHSPPAAKRARPALASAGLHGEGFWIPILVLALIPAAIPAELLARLARMLGRGRGET